MNITTERPNRVYKETTRNPLDVRIILAVLWAAGMLSSLNGDTYRLSNPEVLKTMLDNTGPIVTTPALLLVMALLFVGHIFMSVFTLTLKPLASNRANRVIGIFYAVIILAFWVLDIVIRAPGYSVVWATAQLVFALMVVWYAWKWKSVIDPYVIG